MKNVVTLGKQQITDLLIAYNNGVKSTFGLQKSRHQFAQALKFSNWFELESKLEDSAESVLSPVTDSRPHRMSEQFLAFDVRLPKYSLSSDLLIFFRVRLRPLLEEGAIEGVDEQVLQETFLKNFTEGLSKDELHMAPSFMEIMEWYDVEPDFEEEDVFSYAFDYTEWDNELVKRLIDGVLEPAFKHFKNVHDIEGEFLSSKIVREFKYHTETSI